MSFKTAAEYRDLTSKLQRQWSLCKGDRAHTNCKRCSRAVASGHSDVAVESPKKKTRRAKPKVKASK